MSKPFRLTCPAVADIPSLEDIRALVTREQHLVLQFPLSKRFLFGRQQLLDKRSLIDTLARKLPEYSIFDSGGMEGLEWVTVKAVVSKELVLAHADAFVAAAKQFRVSAQMLIALLADKLGASEEAFGNEAFRFELSDDQYDGESGENWHYAFHGYECRFQNQTTQQVLDVKLGYPGEWGVLDPYFFYEFIKTSLEFQEILALLEDGFHDAARVLDVLEAAGLLRLVVDRHGVRRGRAA